MTTTATDGAPRLTHIDVADLAAATPRQVHHWVARGYLMPGAAAVRRHEAANGGTAGQGRSYGWTPNEVRVAAVMARLVEAGMTNAAAAETARIAVGSVPSRRARNVNVTVGQVRITVHVPAEPAL